MSKVQTSLRLEQETFSEAKIILNKLGMNFTEAVNIFASMVVQTKGLPFEVKIPNDTTIQAIKNARANIDIEEISFEQLKEESKNCLT